MNGFLGIRHLAAIVCDSQKQQAAAVLQTAFVHAHGAEPTGSTVATGASKAVDKCRLRN